MVRMANLIRGRSHVGKRDLVRQRRRPSGACAAPRPPDGTCGVPPPTLQSEFGVRRAREPAPPPVRAVKPDERNRPEPFRRRRPGSGPRVTAAFTPPSHKSRSNASCAIMISII
ncbi:unnamed protein product [Nesidiocoris tenuis]|uniref:Uncharacterized protein n=1 Tax=Nesidiocoris tenuis TaxID=355587 RepID=A0A6H5GGU1_9HEMI|nr:unnamed protein product [Nesidiocoris tenuis]